MTDDFRDMIEATRDIAVALVEANAANAEANAANARAAEAVKRMATVALHARTEHEDLRETVHRLEALVLELVRKSNGQ